MPAIIRTHLNRKIRHHPITISEACSERYSFSRPTNDEMLLSEREANAYKPALRCPGVCHSRKKVSAHTAMNRKNNPLNRLYRMVAADFFVYTSPIPVRTVKSSPCQREWISIQQIACIILAFFVQLSFMIA